MAKQQDRVRRVWLQKSCHLDSITAFWLARNTEAGNRAHPGVDQAKICFWGTGTLSPEGKTWQEHEAQGDLAFGVGGGRYDEHNNPEFGDRKAQGESACSLVAKALKLDRDPRFQRLVEWVTKADQNPVDHLHVANRIKALHRNGVAPQAVIAWADTAIESVVKTQIRFLEAQAEIRSLPKRNLLIFQPGKQEYRVLVIRSDNNQINAASRLKGVSASVVIQANSDGRTFVFTAANKGLSLQRVAIAIRRAELTARNLANDGFGDDELSQPGQLSSVPNWCYQQPGEAMLNGSETACDLEPTALSLDQIVDLVMDNLSVTDTDENASTDTPVETADVAV